MKVSHIGNSYTMTDFKLSDGSHIRLKVGTIVDKVHAFTFYTASIYTKGFKCRNWNYVFDTKTMLDERVLSLISEEQLYQAYYNHWQKINPIRMFAKGQYNSELVNFSVTEKTQDKHFAF